MSLLPSTPRLDAFTRPDEDPLAGSWLGPLDGGGAPLQLVSGGAVGRVGASSTSYWKNPFPLNQEVVVTLATKWTNLDAGLALFVNVQAPGSGGLSGYVVALYTASVDSLDRAELYRIDTGTYAILASVGGGALTFASGDRFWIETVPGLITCSRFAGGVWTPVVSAVDATYGAGVLGLGSDDNTLVIKDVYGGTTGRGGTTRPVTRPFPFLPGTPNLPRRM